MTIFNYPHRDNDWESPAKKRERWREWVDLPVPAEGWEFLTEKILNVSVFEAGGMTPFEAEGLMGDYGFRLVENGGRVSLKLFDRELPHSLAKPIKYEAELSDRIEVWTGNIADIISALVPRLERVRPRWHVTIKDYAKNYEYKSWANGWDRDEAIAEWQSQEDQVKAWTIDDWVEYLEETQGLVLTAALDEAQEFYTMTQNSQREITTIQLSDDVKIAERRALPEKPDLSLQINY